MHDDRARVVFADGVLQVIEWNDLFVQRWTGVGTPEHIERMFDEHARFIDRQPEGTTFGLSHIVTPIVKPPDERMRALMRKHTVELVPRGRASVTLIEHEGFGGAIARGIIAGLMLLTRGQKPHGVRATPREAFSFLAEHRAPGAPRIDLDRAVESYAAVCAQLQPEPRARA